jgi:protein O-mannosyl-transferase
MIAHEKESSPNSAAAPPLVCLWRSKLCSPAFLSLLLTLVTLAVYWPVRHHDYVNYDDADYASANAHVQGGLKWENIAWAFTTGHASNWHPLTWLSHMLDWQLFGNSPGSFHLVSLAFHLANTVLLLLVLRRMTGALWRSGFVAALFALHPVHVESVAWISERKDVLSTLFFLLTIWAYVEYAKKPGVRSLEPEE